MNIERVAWAALGTGAVVAIVSATTESPLPEPTCEGLNVQVVNAGSFEHENVPKPEKFCQQTACITTHKP